MRFLAASLLSLALLDGVRADTVSLVIGSGEGAAKIEAPFGVDFDRDGNLYFCEMVGQRVRKVDAKGALTTIAGIGKKGNGGDDDLGTAAEFNGMHSLVMGPDGSLYLADTWNNRVRKLDLKSGKISSFAGTGDKGFAGDGGPAAKAKFGGVYCICLDPKGEQMYVADLDNRRIRGIDMKTGIVRTVAGNGKKGVPEDGAEAANAPLVDPRAVTADDKGNVYVLERGGHALRVVNREGKIRTVVGTGKAGATGDGGDAKKATLNGPKHLCIDRDGGVLIADTENHLIRKYLPAEGKITRIAGTGKKGIAGLDGPPEDVQLNQPHGIYLHAGGDLYVSDSSNNRVLRIKRGK
jgi:sugar lactone lactonase YvrE